MHHFFHGKSINQANMLGGLFSFLFILLFSFLYIYEEYQAMQKEIKKAEEAYISSQKELIVQETNRALRFIAYKHNKYDGKKDLGTLQRDIVEAIEQMRNERDGTGYIFIYTFDGINIADPFLKQNAGKNLIDFTDPTGKRVIAELIEVSKQPQGGFVEYLWNKPIENTPAPKISYAKAYEPWGWMVGSGVYLDEIQKVIGAERQKYKKKVISFVVNVATLAFILFFIVSTISKYVSSIIEKEIGTFIEFFKNASTSYQFIDRERLQFREFKNIVGFANKMIKEIQDKTNALEEQSATLEQKVQQKTMKLAIKNKALEKSKIFAENLLKAQDKFIKNAIHEINTPLSIILANIDLFTIKYGKNSYLGKIEAGAKMIHNIYNDLSYMVKKDRIQYKKQTIDFSAFLAERLDFFEEVAAGNMLFFDAKIEPSLYVYFNPIELQRICDNNLSNAIKYSLPRFGIGVRLEEHGKRILLEIATRSNKIEDTAQIFSRYYREDEARGGFGIGLNMVKEICDKNGVKIVVVSGDDLTLFRYFFPLFSKESA